MSFFDRILQSLEDFFTGTGRGRPTTERFIDEPIIRKFVSGLFYCGDKQKRTFFAIIFERNDVDREEDLLDVLINAHPECSKMREYHGYSEEEVESAETLDVIEDGEL